MAIKRILGGKSKNLFDISKSNTNSRNYVVGDMFYCNTYGFNMGTVQQLCPSLKAGDVVILTMWCIKKYKSGPTFFSFGGHSGTIQVDNGIYSLMKSFTITESDLTKPVYIYNQNHSDRGVPFELICRLQLEYGTTRTDYVPYELTSYKSIMKVSDVCQLVDISKYQIKSGTKNGVSWQVNQDGSITLNGTCTTGFLLNPNNTHFDCDQTHIYYTFPYTAVNYAYDIDGNHMKGAIIKISTSARPTKFNTVLWTWCSGGITYNNVVVRHGVCDLTEMFGTGNEPKTVAEFKAKFPNDYYPYSPSCFVTSFDERMPCKTKNLFDINANSEKGYYDEQGNFWPTDRFLCFTIDVLSNSTYCISTSKLGSVKGIVSFWNNNTFVSAANNGEHTAFAYTVPSGANKLKFVIEANQKYSNIQIELGTTATDYVPYNYV